MAVAEYKIVRGSNAAALSAEVTAALADGWQPSGSIVRDTDGGALLQPLVKMEPEEPVVGD